MITPSAIPPGPVDVDRAQNVYRNLDVETLVRHCLERDGCERATGGAIVARTGKYTGRTPKDKAIVREAGSEARVWWENNAAMEPGVFDALRGRFGDYARGKELYIVDTYAGADPEQRLKVRFIVERPYHALFIRQLLIRPSSEELTSFAPDWTVVDFGRLTLDPAVDRTLSEATIALNMDRREVLIAGTEYAGEMKKSVFTIMNYLLPLKGVLSMHCSANIGPDGATALFFGLSGTGKTTLSADPERILIGDDEHGWTDSGVFNIEGGCYAKCIDLSAEGEPEIFAAIREGAVLENVVLKDGVPDYADSSITENTRAAYPIDHIANAASPSIGGHPENIVFLTADAMGVLPPIAKLTRAQAIEFFLHGYTAKVAGTEAGVTEPQAVFSTCFGAPFLPLKPRDYADLLGEKIDRHDPKVWLVNTGWTGGPYGEGHRMKLAHTRAMLHAALSGGLDGAEFIDEPVFGLSVPKAVSGVPDAILSPRGTWDDPAAYDTAAASLVAKFRSNAAKFV